MAAWQWYAAGMARLVRCADRPHRCRVPAALNGQQRLGSQRGGRRRARRGDPPSAARRKPASHRLLGAARRGGSRNSGVGNRRKAMRGENSSNEPAGQAAGDQNGEQTAKRLARQLDVSRPLSKRISTGKRISAKALRQTASPVESGRLWRLK